MVRMVSSHWSPSSAQTIRRGNTTMPEQMMKSDKNNPRNM